MTFVRTANSPVEAFEHRAQEQAMRFASNSLVKALRAYEADAGARRREALRQSTVSRGVKPLPVARPTPVLRHAAQDLDPRPPAASREPCPRCQTRGDLGCAHFAPFEPIAR